MSSNLTPGILVKAVGGGAGLEGEGLAAGPRTPLFHSIGKPQGGLGLVATPGPAWSRIEAATDSPARLWDHCHSLMRGAGMGAAGGAVVFAEPDLAQQWTWDKPRRQAIGLASACDAPRPPAPEYPAPPSFAWFREAGFSDFGPVDARAGRGARIAHLDTGFDPAHSTVPPHLDRARQRNFVDDSRPSDATDTADGPTAQHGHGTATLALLGSAAYGGAPGAEIIPMRVADSVVLFSNSSIARALDEVHRLTVGDGDAPVDVVSMSMGGLASQAWAEAVNALYDTGVFIATAAGNNYANLPTRLIVYPARFDRVTAACGVMSDLRPYADLAPTSMAGDYGPAHKMETAVAAATPNVPWARFGCPQAVDPMGGGTSSATPQVAAAAALWIAAHRTALMALPEPWMRVEAVRHALFSTALRPNVDRTRLGWGRLDVARALAVGVADVATLSRKGPDNASWNLFHAIFGVSATSAPADRPTRLLELEALQVSQRFRAEAVVDVDKPLDAWTPAERRLLAEAIADRPEASETLKTALGVRGTSAPTHPASGPPAAAHPAPAVPPPPDPMAAQHLKLALNPPPPTPARRRLRAYAYDPATSSDIERYGLNEAALDVRWEDHLAPGPVGEYLEIVDIDPAGDCAYAPVDLNHPNLLAADGLAPNESDPQFHQQMTYAVAMKTIEHFELALGRVALWAPTFLPGAKKAGKDPEDYVQHLRVYPHAIRDENAFYSPERSALLFGYFNARDKAGAVLRRGVVHSCLSHDIVAHETTHALLDGLHRYYREAANPDALAFHEAFADIVALFQHFTVPEALHAEIARSEGHIERETLLGKLAVQFGQATGHRGALRSYIGQTDPVTGKWRPHQVKPTDYPGATEVHDKGAVLVSAVFEAFLTVYRLRSVDLLRLATGGTGILPQGAISADLATRLTQEAAHVATDLLQMCIRALDYCPPVDLTFGDYLRALITADQDVSGEARRDYRIALISAFRDRGIYPEGLKSLSPSSVAWDPPAIDLPHLADALVNLDRDINKHWTLYTNRRQVWENSKAAAKSLRDALMHKDFPKGELEALGLVRVATRATFPLRLADQDGELHGFEVHSVRPARRVDSQGQARTHLVVEITQRWSTAPWPKGGKADPNVPRLEIESVRGGCTLLFDMESQKVRYLVRKRLTSPRRVEAQLAFKAAAGLSSLRGAYWTDERVHGEPFAALHSAI